MRRAVKIIACILLSTIAVFGDLFFNGICAYAEGYPGEKLAEFRTEYSSSSDARKHNIELAVKSIDGTVLEPGEEFSFNGTVGARTEQNGYRNAKIIVKGKFEDGVGGGVCQVSTTLYNAVLRSGLTVTESHAHSLPVSYVQPSFDAMVSEGADFKFLNDTPYPVRIEGRADGTRVRFALYGFPMITDGETVVFRSVKVKEVSSEEYEEVLDTSGELGNEPSRVIKEPRSGLISEGYADVFFRGELIKSVRIRRDYYAPQKGTVLVKSLGAEQ